MATRLLSKLHLIDKIALFGIFAVKFFDYVFTHALKIFRQICTKMANFLHQSEFRKKSIRFPADIAKCILILLLACAPLSAVDEEWKPSLDLFLEDQGLDGDADFSLNEEFLFPTSKENLQLFSLDDLLEPPPVDIAQEETPETRATQLPETSPPPLYQGGISSEGEITPFRNAPTNVSPGESQTIIAGGTAPTPPDNTILINFNNVSIIEFIRFISRATNKNFIFNDADMQFNVTIVSEEPTTISNIMTALMQILRVHGLSLIEQGNNIIIHTSQTVNQISQVVAEGVPQTVEAKDADLITRVFRLNTLDADQAAIIIQPLVSEGALVEVLRKTGHIVVTDVATNVNKIGQLLRSLDAPNSGLTMGQYVVVNALIDSLISLGQQVMAPIAEDKPLVFVAHQPSNSIFVVSTPFIVDRALAVLRTLDINVGQTRIFTPESLRFTGTSQESQQPGAPGQPGGRLPGEPGEADLERFPGGTGAVFPGQETRPGHLESISPWSANLPTGHIQRTKFYIHKLGFRRGDEIVNALTSIGTSLLDSGAGNLDLIATIQSIQWLEGSNSLVFTGTTESIAKVKELIDEIDLPLRQVFIEMLILEIDLDDSLNYGVNWGSRFRTDTAAGAEAFLSGANTLNSGLDSTLPGGNFDASPLARTQGFHLGIIGRNLSVGGFEFNSIGALVTAVHNKTKTEILMNPKILVEDQSTAEIFVGINTPYQTQSIANDLGNIVTSNFEYRDVGTRLKVTPTISDNDIITLDILEEVSSIASQQNVSGTLTNAPSGPTTNQSRSVTRVHVPNKYFLVMSGMIQDQLTRSRDQVPCLGGAPIIGALFSEKDLRDQKRNLMIFIRPWIIDSTQDIDDVTRHQQDIHRNKSRSKKMWKYEVEEALDLLNIKDPDVSLHDTEVYNP